jgi:hypothetical protein
MKHVLVRLLFLALTVTAGCRTTDESSDASSFRPAQNNSPKPDLVDPKGKCTKDINEHGLPSNCDCPADYVYNDIIGKCGLSTRICSKAMVPMFYPVKGKCIVVGDGCAAADLGSAGWRRKDANDVCPAPNQPPQNGGSAKQVAGFGFQGLKTLDRAPSDQVCAAIVNAEEEACLNAGGLTFPAKGCVVLCSQPIAKKGSVAGYDFAGPRVAPALPANSACPALANAETDACLNVNGDTTYDKRCKTLCSKPIAKKGKVAGFDFSGFKSADALPANFACPQVADAVTDACLAVGGETTYTKGCGILCSFPIAK